MTAAVGPNLKRLTDDTGAPAFQVDYSLDWTGLQTKIGKGIPGAEPGSDARNQMQYPDPPNDQTMLTACTYHLITAQDTTCPVIFTSGTVKPLDAKKFYQYGWDVANH